MVVLNSGKESKRSGSMKLRLRPPTLLQTITFYLEAASTKDKLSFVETILTGNNTMWKFWKAYYSKSLITGRFKNDTLLQVLRYINKHGENLNNNYNNIYYAYVI